MSFVRPRRLRSKEALRELFSQTQIRTRDLIMPYFVIEGKNKIEPIKSMPGTSKLSIDNLIKDIREIKSHGISVVLLFGVCKKKDKNGSESYNPHGLIQKAIKAIKNNVEDIVVASDVCLCGYTKHGHCGIFRSQKSEVRSQKQKKKLSSVICHLSSDFIDNDQTIKILAKIALSHARAGADFVAPSSMMDGQVKAIRESLDSSGFDEVGILAYSAKYSSNFYGPFREVLDSTPQFGDRKTYQMDYRNSDEALREIQQDIDEGADIVMVKPALAYLDIIYRAKQKFNIPIAAYNVSGEYGMIKKLADKDKNLEKNLVLEILTSIKRAGANLVISYHAKDMAKWLKS